MSLDLLMVDPLDRYLTEIPGLGGASPPQMLFHKDPASRRILRGGNQIGKTRAGSAEAWQYAMGSHRFKQVKPAPNCGWIMASDLRNGWPSISAKMREIQPLGVLDPACTYDRARGYSYRGIRAIKLADPWGSVIIGKGSDQSVIALSGESLAWCWVDEPPKEAHFSEIRTRLSATSGDLFITLTPAGRAVEFLRDLIDGNPHTGAEATEPGWSSHVVPLSWEACPHRTQADIEAQIASIPLHERSIRINAGWEGITISRQVPGFSSANIFEVGPDHPLDNLVSLGIGVDYGQKPSHTVYTLVGWSEVNNTLYCLNEWAPDATMSTREEIIGVQDHLLKPWGVDFYHIEHWRGDSNSAGRMGIGGTINTILEREIADLLGSPTSVISCRPPYKRAGSVKARSRLISSKCVEGKCMVHVDCTRIISSLRHWMGEPRSRFKHGFDAFGYISDVYYGLNKNTKNQQFRIVR